MNERIRQLAEKAWDATAAGPEPVILVSFAEKFALLIVRECANRIDYWESRQGEHSDDLLKHFGVEA